MTAAEGSAPEPTPDAGVEELQADIAATREQLGETVAALGDKLDVKARAEQKLADVEQRVRARPVVPAAIGALAVAALVLWVVRRRRR